ncbi:MAG: rhomboid family intramembrane serine protease [Candidatus Poribacteria bacterium]|nr:rhomboid family intramembrane serine protease [Candidatus Poribacteria bacterium]
MQRGFFGGNQFRRQGTLPPVLKTLLLLNAGIYLAQMISANIMPFMYELLFHPGIGLLPLKTNLDPRLAHVYGLFQPWQLITYMFLHASLFHIGFNMLALWLFGVEIEERWGTQHFLTYYLICGIGGGVLQIVMPMLLQSLAPILSGIMPFGFTKQTFQPKPVVGASGAVYGVLLAFGMIFPKRTVFIPLFIIMIPVPARTLVIFYAGISIFGGLSGGGGVAHFAHLGGMAFGYIYIKIQQQRRKILR